MYSPLADSRCLLSSEANALDQAEYAIHLPQLHHQQQLWRLESFWMVGKLASKD